MTNSVKIERPPHDPIASTLSAADDRIVMSEWLPPQEGIVPRIRIGRRWINILWALPIGAAALVLAHRSRAELARASKRAGLHQGIPRYRAGCALGRFRISVVAATAALPEHAFHDVHHSRRDPDPGGSPAPLLDPRLHARYGVVSLPVSGTRGPDLDLEGRFGDGAWLAGHSRRSSFHRACPLVAFLGRDAVDTQRHRILRIDYSPPVSGFVWSP